MSSYLRRGMLKACPEPLDPAGDSPRRRACCLVVIAALLPVLAGMNATPRVQATPPISSITIEFDSTTKNVGSHAGDVYSAVVGDLGGDSPFRLPEGAATASVVSYQEDFLQGTEWKTSGCAAGQGLWQKTSVLPMGVTASAPAYWYGKQPALDFKPDQPPAVGPCPGLDPPCYRCLPGGYYQPQYSTGDLCAYGGGQHCGNLTSPRINLYNVPPPIVLEFKNCLDIQPQPTPPGPVIIQARVEIAVNGGEFFTLKSFTTNVNCTAETIDLSDYANSIIQLRWFMVVIGTSSYATNAYGWVVDDVKVIGGFDSSTDTPNPDQRLYVADTGNHRIQVFEYEAGGTSFAYKGQFGGCGDGEGQFCLPEDVVVGPNGLIYVADTGNHRIQVFDKDGAHEGQFGSYGSGQGQFNSPSGVTVSGWVLKAGGEPGRVADFFYLHVADTLNHRVQWFKVSKTSTTGVGTFAGETGFYGGGNGQFSLPEGIAADPIDTPAFLAPEMFQLPIVPEQWEGHVYVADANNHRVQYFELIGAFAGKWGTYGDGDNNFNTPQDVDVGIRLEAPIKNESNRSVDVYVADTGNHQVKRFNEAGTWMDTFGQYGDLAGQFNSPAGLAVDRLPQQLSLSDYPQSVGVEGNAFTVDTGNHRIHYFDRTGTFLGRFGSYGVANTVSSTTTSNSSPNPSAVGQTVTFTATVTETVSGTAVTAGTVTFKDGGTAIPGGEDVALNVSGQAIFTTSSLAVGSHSVTAEFSPDPCSCLDGSSSPQLTHQVNERGTIIVEKETSPDGTADSFTFTGDAAGAISDGGQIVVSDLAPGTYTATEDDPGPGFDLTSITCDDGNSSGNVGTRTATFVLDPDETVKCTFTNTKQGTISIVKDAAPDDSQDFDFSGDLGNFFLDDDTDPTLPNTATFQYQAPGTYSVSEVSIPAGWNLSSIVCNDPDGGTTTDLGTATANIDLDAGEGIVCTFSNIKQGTISIVKDAVPDDAQDFGFGGDLGDFTLDDDANATLPNSVTFSGLAPGDYNVSEASIPAGWNLTSIVCNDPDGGTTTDLGTATASIDLGADEGIVCTFTNGTLSVETATGTGIATFDSDACVFEDLIAVAEATLPTAGKPNLDFEHGFFSFKLVACSPGQTVNVSIAFPSNIPVGAQYWKYQDGVGWYQIPVGDDDGDNVLTIQLTDGGLGDGDGLANGEIDDPGGPGLPLGTIIVEKQTSPDGAAGSFTFSGDAAGAISDDGQIVVADLLPGAYTASEADPSPEFELTAITCSDGNSSGNVGTRTATFNLEAGETVKCTFSNARRSLKVTKELELPVGGLAAIGQTLRFEIEIFNDGGVDFASISLTDDFAPWCMTARRASLPPDSGGGGVTPLVWNDLGPLATGQRLEMWVEFTAAHGCEDATNTATVTADGLMFEDEASLRILETIARSGGYAFHDDNGSGALEWPCQGADNNPAGCEPGIERATASLDGLLYTTNTSGWWSFNLLDPGTYHVDLATPTGDSYWTPTGDTWCDMTIVNTWDQVFCHRGYWWGLDWPPLLGPVADDTMTFYPTQDTFISGWQAGNHGAAEHVQVRQPGYASTLLQFDRSGLPLDATPVWAKIKLYAPFASNSTNRLYMTAYPLDKAWVEDEVTWLQAENGLPWTEAGATGDHGDPVGWAWIDAPGWVEFDLDPAELLANDYGFLLRGEGSENRQVSYWFFSSEYVNADVHPQLVVGYNLP